LAQRLLLAVLIGSAAWLGAAQAQGSRVPLPKFSVDKTTQCVAPPEVMRRTHMDLLKHRRDRTVHQGVRGGDESLNRCIECHAAKTSGAVAGTVVGAPDAFCQSCHDYVGVRLDCFECHQGRPGTTASAKSP
jgi:predicted CXXCH cytochrome family protein